VEKVQTVGTVRPLSMYCCRHAEQIEGLRTTQTHATGASCPGQHLVVVPQRGRCSWVTHTPSLRSSTSAQRWHCRKLHRWPSVSPVPRRQSCSLQGRGSRPGGHRASGMQAEGRRFCHPAHPQKHTTWLNCRCPAAGQKLEQAGLVPVHPRGVCNHCTPSACPQIGSATQHHTRFCSPPVNPFAHSIPSNSR